MTIFGSWADNLVIKWDQGSIGITNVFVYGDPKKAIIIKIQTVASYPDVSVSSVGDMKLNISTYFISLDKTKYSKHTIKKDEDIITISGVPGVEYIITEDVGEHETIIALTPIKILDTVKFERSFV